MPSLPLLFQATLNGLLMGGVYSLIAVGLSLIFGVMRIVNFAHGDMMVLGMYVAYWAFVLTGMDPFLAVPLGAAVTFAIGYFVQRHMVNRILDVPDEMQFLLMLGVAIIVRNLILVFSGPDSRSVQTRYSLAVVELGRFILDVPRLLAFAGALALTLGLFLFLKKTDLGVSIRAAADNRVGALLVGTDIYRLYALAFGIAAATVGAGGAMVISFLPASPPIGHEFTLTGFVVVILGGMGSLPGAFLGGLIVGISEALGAVLLESSVKQLASFALLILILLFRPQGLLGGRG